VSEKPDDRTHYKIRLMELHFQYERLDWELRDLNQLLLADIIETTLEPRYVPLSGLWKSQADAIAAQMKEVMREIEAITPSPELLAYMGERLYFAYQEKYPINKDTKLVQGYFPYQTWRYPLPQAFNVFSVADIQEAPPSSFKMDYGEAVFEYWRDGSGFEERLAYAKELNTVFVHRDTLRGK